MAFPWYDGDISTERGTEDGHPAVVRCNLLGLCGPDAPLHVSGRHRLLCPAPMEKTAVGPPGIGQRGTPRGRTAALCDVLCRIGRSDRLSGQLLDAVPLAGGVSGAGGIFPTDAAVPIRAVHRLEALFPVELSDHGELDFLYGDGKCAHLHAGGLLSQSSVEAPVVDSSFLSTAPPM